MMKQFYLHTFYIYSCINNNLLCIFSNDQQLGQTSKTVRVNNLLATLNPKPICNLNLEMMELRAWEVIKESSAECCQKAASAAFQMEMGYVFIFDISLQGEGV